jgi:hypothetical protein
MLELQHPTNPILVCAGDKESATVCSCGARASLSRGGCRTVAHAEPTPPDLEIKRHIVLLERLAKIVLE